MSVLFESPDYSQDFCEGCMAIVPGDHVCSPERLRRAKRRYNARNAIPWTPMVVGPVAGFETAEGDS